MSRLSHCIDGCAALALVVVLTAPAGAAVFHVPGDAPSIQAAIALASSGDTIQVGPGTWPEHIDFLGKQLVIKSDSGAQQTSLHPSGNGSVVTARSGEPAGTALIGFNVSGGIGQTVAPGAGFGGGGIFVGAASSLDVSQCDIEDNVVGGPITPTYGGGVAVVGSAARITLTDCVLAHNSSQRGAAIDGIDGNATISLKNCIIAKNIATPGFYAPFAIFLGYSGGTLEDCLIADNTGSGLFFYLYGHTFKNCVFKGNSGWGLVNSAAFGGDVSDCAFLGNGLGGALLGDSSFVGSYSGVRRCVFAHGDKLEVEPYIPSDIENCTFDGTHVEALNDGLSTATIVNCIFRNTAAPIVGATSLQVTYTDIQGGFPGVGNIDADPLWVDAATDDYQLSPGSPCIDTGDPASPHDADLSQADMGALPFDPWTDLGHGLAGGAGMPLLVGTGSLVGGAFVSTTVSHLLPNGVASLVLGFAEIDAPFKGGVLVPAVNVLVPALPTGSSGLIDLPTTWPAGVPSGFSFYEQYWQKDPAGPFGYAASNAIRGTTP